MKWGVGGTRPEGLMLLLGMNGRKRGKVERKKEGEANKTWMGGGAAAAPDPPGKK